MGIAGDNSAPRHSQNLHAANKFPCGGVVTDGSNKPHTDRDQRLLELLAELETIGQRDQAIRELAAYLTSTATATAIPGPLVGLSSEPVTAEPLPAPAWQNHALGMVPIEYQSMAATAMQHATRRTLIMGGIAAAALGAYTGHVAIPPQVKAMLTTTPAGNCPEVITHVKAQ
jgi:hypothetical protein